MIDRVKKELKEFGEQGIDSLTLTVRSAKDFCKRLDLKFIHATKYKIETIYGIPVVESKYMPDNRAVLIDSEQRIVKIFDI